MDVFFCEISGYLLPFYSFSISEKLSCNHVVTVNFTAVPNEMKLFLFNIEFFFC